MPGATLETCDLIAGFAAAYDAPSNRTFERPLHAECRGTAYVVRDEYGDPFSGYDSAGRLAGFERGHLEEGGLLDQAMTLEGVRSREAYALDAAGNRVTGAGGGGMAVTFAVGCGPEEDLDLGTNELNQVTSADIAVAYDGRGNLTTYRGLTLEYDAFNRLIAVTGTNSREESVNVSYSYDAQGRRVRRGSTVFLHAGDQVVEERGAGGAVLRQYVWGQYVDELVQQREYERAPEGMDAIDYYLLSDVHYRAAALTSDPCGCRLFGTPQCEGKLLSFELFRAAPGAVYSDQADQRPVA